MQLPRAFLAVARWCEVITVRQICEFTIKEISGAGNKRSPTKSAQHASASASSNDHSVNGFRRRDSLASRVVFVATSDAGECVVVFQMRFMAGQLGSQASVLDRRRSQTHPVESERSFSRYLILQRRFHAHHNSSAVQTIRTDPNIRLPRRDTEVALKWPVPASACDTGKPCSLEASKDLKATRAMRGCRFKPRRWQNVPIWGQTCNGHGNSQVKCMKSSSSTSWL